MAASVAYSCSLFLEVLSIFYILASDVLCASVSLSERQLNSQSKMLQGQRTFSSMLFSNGACVIPGRRSAYLKPRISIMHIVHYVRASEGAACLLEVGC